MLERFEVAAFAVGKLPFRGDFIRVGTKEGDADRWLDWMSEGAGSLRSQWGDQFGDRFVKMPFWRFAIALPSAAMSSVGIMAPSTDSLGRLFPVVCGGYYPQAAESTAILARCATWLDGLEEVVCRLLAPDCGDDDFAKLMGQVPAPPFSAPRQETHGDHDVRIGEGPIISLLTSPYDIEPTPEVGVWATEESIVDLDGRKRSAAICGNGLPSLSLWPLLAGDVSALGSNFADDTPGAANV